MEYRTTELSLQQCMGSRCYSTNEPAARVDCMWLDKPTALQGQAIHTLHGGQEFSQMALGGGIAYLWTSLEGVWLMNGTEGGVAYVTSCTWSHHSLVPRPLPDFISPWLRGKIWEWPGDKASHITHFHSDPVHAERCISWASSNCQHTRWNLVCKQCHVYIPVIRVVSRIRSTAKHFSLWSDHVVCK